MWAVVLCCVCRCYCDISMIRSLCVTGSLLHRSGLSRCPVSADVTTQEHYCRGGGKVMIVLFHYHVGSTFCQLCPVFHHRVGSTFLWLCPVFHHCVGSTFLWLCPVFHHRVGSTFLWLCPVFHHRVGSTFLWLCLVFHYYCRFHFLMAVPSVSSPHWFQSFSVASNVPSPCGFPSCFSVSFAILVLLLLPFCLVQNQRRLPKHHGPYV